MNTKIIPYLWYDHGEAKSAAEYYTSIFKNSTLLDVSILTEAPAGDTEVVRFEIEGVRFEAIGAGPYFKLNPSVSLMVYCDSKDEVNRIWHLLSEGGVPLMPLDKYPFSNWYGWIQDQYGLSWQIMYVDKISSQKIKPSFLFSKDVCGKAREAIEFYTQTFENSKIMNVIEFQEGEPSTPEAKLSYAEFKLNSLEFIAMDHGERGDFTFNEAFSMMVMCRDQKEIDYYWEALSVVPEAENCGWLKDKFGLSWQIVPSRYYEMMDNGTSEQIERVSKEVLKMKKINLEILEKAYLQ